MVTWTNGFIANLPELVTATIIDAATQTALTASADAFIDAYNTANNEFTRTRATIYIKNEKKADWLRSVRVVVDQIQVNPLTTDAMRANLGITVRRVPSPVPAPTTSPTITLTSETGRRVKVTMRDRTSTGRGRPAGVEGITVLTYVGEDAPKSTSDWSFAGNTSTMEMTTQFPANTPAGAKVWVTAFYFNPRKQSGPAAVPVSTNLLDNGVNQESSTMRLAA